MKKSIRNEIAKCQPVSLRKELILSEQERITIISSKSAQVQFLSQNMSEKES